MLGRRDRQKSRKKSGGLRQTRSRRGQHDLKLPELLIGRVLRRQARRMFDVPGDRIKRAVGMKRRALIMQPQMRLRGDPLLKGARKARFANTSLAPDQLYPTC